MECDGVRQVKLGMKRQRGVDVAWVRCSARDRQGDPPPSIDPINSMSGSFQWPGAAAACDDTPSRDYARSSLACQLECGQH